MLGSYTDAGCGRSETDGKSWVERSQTAVQGASDDRQLLHFPLSCLVPPLQTTNNRRGMQAELERRLAALRAPNNNNNRSALVPSSRAAAPLADPDLRCSVATSPAASATLEHLDAPLTLAPAPVIELKNVSDADARPLSASPGFADPRSCRSKPTSLPSPRLQLRRSPLHRHPTTASTPRWNPTSARRPRS